MDEQGPADPAEFTSAAERELHRKLEVVRADAPVPGTELEGSVARTLRWQALIVVPVTAGLAIAGGVVAAVRALKSRRRHA